MTKLSKPVSRDIYRLAARWHAMKEFDAKRAARKQGVPWKQAQKQFKRANRIPFL